MFKAGDRVRCIKPVVEGFHSLDPSKIYTIISDPRGLTLKTFVHLAETGKDKSYASTRFVLAYNYPEWL